MKVVKTNGTIKGKARIKVTDTKVLVTFEDKPDQKFKLDRDECPDNLKSGDYYVNLNADGDELVGVRPIMGMFRCKFKNMFVPEGEDIPQPQFHEGGPRTSKDGRKWNADDYYSYMPMMEIVEGDYKGWQIPVYLNYLFVDDGDGHIMIKGGGKKADMNVSFLDATGVLEKEIKFSENVLPRLQKEILKEARIFLVYLKEGNVDAFATLPEEEPDVDEDEDLTQDDDEDEPVKSKAKVSIPDDDEDDED